MRFLHKKTTGALTPTSLSNTLLSQKTTRAERMRGDRQTYLGNPAMQVQLLPCAPISRPHIPEQSKRMLRQREITNQDQAETKQSQASGKRER